MTEIAFPSIPGLAWGTTRKPTWRTRVQKSVSGRRAALEYMSFPLYTWALQFNVLRQYSTFAELAELQGFFNARHGMADTFLFADPHDAAAIDEQIGIGDAAETDFQLTRTYGGFVEPVYAPNTWTIYVDGVEQTSGFTVSVTGLVEFAVAPTAGQVITWTGSFRYRVAFTQDTIDLINQDGVDVWKSGKISFESVKP